MEEQKSKSFITKSGISIFEWCLAVGAVLVVDVIQFLIELLDLTIVGAIVPLVVNRFIDVVVGLALGFYYKLRGIDLDTKRILTFMGAVLGEFMPVADALPLWTADVILMMSMDIGERQLETFSPEAAEALHKTAQAADVANKAKTLLPPGAKPSSAVPPRIGASGRPMATPGAVPPVMRQQAGPGA
ncbi:MAG TPA: hypothetical protein VJH94_01545, partial [Candidatus Paceibacterota bacterium]